MDTDDLLDYALGRLDGLRREQIEHRIACDPVLAGRVARLIRNLERLLDDGRGPRPPEGAPSLRPPTDSPSRQDLLPQDGSGALGERPPSDLR